MPLYEYKCLKCDNTIEKIIKINDESRQLVIHCINCASDQVYERQIATPHFQGIGEGFYDKRMR